MAVDLGWISGHTFSSDIAVISILFLVVYIALYTLCTTCLSSLTPECLEPSSLPLNVNLDHGSTHRTTSNVDVSSAARCDTPQVPDGSQHLNHTAVYSHKTNIYSHNRAKSDGFFNQKIPPRIPNTPEFSIRSTGSLSSVLPALPPIPTVFYFTRVQVEPEKVPPSFSGYQLETKRSVSERVTALPEAMNSEEHLYECIDNVGVTGPSSPAPIDEAEENLWESESPYDTVTEWSELTATVMDSKKLEEIKMIFPPLPGVWDETNQDGDVLYAAVNKNNKSQKSIKREASDGRDIVVLDEDEAPPVPDKIFNSLT